VKESEMGEVYGTHGREMNTRIWWEDVKEGDCWEDIARDGEIILNYIKETGWDWTGLG
jgi:hypothetical protein